MPTGTGNTGGTSVGPAPPGNANTGGTSVSPDTGSGNTGGAFVSGVTPPGAAVESGTQVNLLGGMISPATVTEERPGRAGSAISAHMLRRIGRIESRVSSLESIQ
jgi:hypothetical protein